EQNGVRFIETADETRVMENCVKLRSFVPYGNAILGAFTDNYLYTYVAPLSIRAARRRDTRNRAAGAGTFEL
ncbi:MAG: hypothetical protein J6S70_04010, partial [Clostridia bacterium]|nr:hypothetical protein [Clostridia bacterium]